MNGHSVVFQQIVQKLGYSSAEQIRSGFANYKDGHLMFMQFYPC